jgi:hypothetical protein
MCVHYDDAGRQRGKVHSLLSPNAAASMAPGLRLEAHGGSKHTLSSGMRLPVRMDVGWPLDIVKVGLECQPWGVTGTAIR